MSAERRTGETKSTGFQVGARRTFDVSAARAWKLVSSSRGSAVWLGAGAPARFVAGQRFTLDDGSEGEVRVVSDSHLRLSWHPAGWERASTVQVRVIPRGARTVIAFHQEHLPGPDEREERKSFYGDALDALGAVLSDPP